MQTDGTQAGAGRRERVAAVFFWLRLALLLGLAGTCWGTGAGEALARRMPGRGDGGLAGMLGYALFAGMCVLTYEILLFPLARLSAVRLPEADGSEEAGFGSWLRSYLLMLLAETGAVAAGAAAFHGLYRFAGAWWWLVAALAYRAMSPDLWPIALRVRPERMREAGGGGFLGRANAALGRCGLRQAESVAVFTAGERAEGELREVHFAYRRGRKLPRLVFLDGTWRGRSEEARLFLAVQEGALRKWRRWNRVATVAGTAAVFWGTGRFVESVAAARGWPGLASPEAFPALVAVLFAASTVFGLVCNAWARHGQRKADETACRGLEGLAEMRAWAAEEAGEVGPGRPSGIPWWTAILRNERDAAARLEAASRRFGNGAERNG